MGQEDINPLQDKTLRHLLHVATLCNETQIDGDTDQSPTLARMPRQPDRARKSP